MLTEKKNVVYAVKDEMEAPLTIQRERLLLHTLRPGKDGCLVIPHEFTKGFFDSRKRTVFLQVGTEDESFGFLYFKLLNDTKFSDQFLAMCLGVKGVSYRGNLFFAYDEERNSLKSGDYQNNDGTGGTAVISGLGDNFESTYEYKPPRGTLIANPISTRFEIVTSSRYDGKDRYGMFGRHGIVGHLNHGVHILEKLVKVKKEKKVIIKDCGAFIPLTHKEN